jgi:hypothetical protein
MILLAIGGLLMCGVFIADDVKSASSLFLAGLACIYFGLGI